MVRFEKATFEKLNKMESLLAIRQQTGASLKDAVELYEHVMAYGFVELTPDPAVGNRETLTMLYVAFAYAIEALGVNQGKHVWPEYLKEWSELAATLRQFNSITTTDRWVIDRFAKMYQDIRLPPDQYEWYRERIFGTSVTMGG